MCDEAKTMYETSGELDEKQMADISWKNMTYQIRHIWVMLLLIAVMAVLLMLDGNETAGLLLLLCIVMAGLLLWMPGAMRKKSNASFREAAPGGKLCYTSSFSSEQLHLKNHTNGASGAIDLIQFTRVFQVGEVWALISKGNMIYPVFASQLSETDQKSVLSLLKEKNPKIKIDLKEKK